MKLGVKLAFMSAVTAAVTSFTSLFSLPAIDLSNVMQITTESGPVSYYGEMTVDGNKIVGSKTNEPMRVTGMSFFWSNWSTKYYTADYVDLMKDSFGCEVVRCAYGIQDNGIPYDKSCEPLINDVIEEAIKKDIYVIVDWHSHGAQNNPDEAVAYFSQLAKDYGQFDNLIFEVYNEPKNVGWKDVKAYAEKVITEIRKYSDNMIIVGTPTWSQDVDVAAKDPIKDDNVAYALHFYAGTHKKYLRDKADRAMEAGIALFVSEWGGVNSNGNGAIDKTSTTEWFDWIDENMLSSCNWAVNDKNESSSIFKSDKEISDSGKFIKKLIKARTSDSPWTKAQ